MTSLMIYRLGDEAPVRLAAKEVARCLRAMTKARVVVRGVAAFQAEQAGIYVGLPEHFCGVRAPKADRWDDALLVRSVGESLILTGSNERSVLFAAYRWLEALGARWLRPGKDGEYLPKIDAPTLTGWEIREQAANRHRGICIEGTCYIEQVLELIDLMPKLRMNAYMLQFRVSAYFWRRWYERDVPGANDEPRLLTLEECAALDDRVADAVKERGLLYHKVGHGWTCEAVGNHGSGWEKEESAPVEIRPLLAEVNGIRDWWGGVPLNTELCYSNPEARRRFVDEVIVYAQAHPEVDVLHIWASDGMNNHCECADCARLQPSDWYITLLNEVSPRLKEVAPEMRIVALCYSNTMWPPYQVPPAGLGDNLIFMFAPISRCYAHSILDPKCSAKPPLQPWSRNQVGAPRANSDYRDMLKAWQDYLPAGTDAFVFDYHFWIHFPNDLLTSDFARMTYRDVREYHRAGVNGMVHCQLQRTSLPTALAQIAAAEYLWSDRVTAREVEDQYFSAAFGPTSELARGFLGNFRKLVGAGTNHDHWWNGRTPRMTRKVVKLLRAALPKLRTTLKESGHPVWKLSWKLLLHWTRYMALIWMALDARARGQADAPAKLDKAVAYLQRIEPQVYPWMDIPFWLHAPNAMRAQWQEEDKKVLVEA